jgi:hypothetical protein
MIKALQAHMEDNNKIFDELKNVKTKYEIKIDY